MLNIVVKAKTLKEINRICRNKENEGWEFTRPIEKAHGYLKHFNKDKYGYSHDHTDDTFYYRAAFSRPNDEELTDQEKVQQTIAKLKEQLHEQKKRAEYFKERKEELIYEWRLARESADYYKDECDVLRKDTEHYKLENTKLVVERNNLKRRIKNG